MNSITIVNLTKKFGNVNALNGLSLKVDSGSVFGFLGPNGAGKTTTLRILAGLAQATSGKIAIDGMVVTNITAGQRAITGYLPEEPAFYLWMSPLEYLDYVGRIFKLNGKQRQARIDQLLTQMDLKDVARRHIGGFSRGMRQRLGIAQALMNHPSILLLDEPVSALDPAGRKEVLEMIEGLGKSCTVIMSSHILADVEKVCDTIGIIDQGRLITQARKELLMNRYAIPALELTIANGSASLMPDWKKRLENLQSIAGVITEGYTLRVTAKDVQAAQREIMLDALQHNVHLERLEVVKPSLEDIFMQLTRSQK